MSNNPHTHPCQGCMWPQSCCTLPDQSFRPEPEDGPDPFNENTNVPKEETMKKMICKCCGYPYEYPPEALTDHDFIRRPMVQKPFYEYCACDLRICEGFNKRPCLYPNYPADQMTEYFNPHKEDTVNTDFIICPGCNGESNRDVEVKCGTCGCAGIIPKKEENMSIHNYAITLKNGRTLPATSNDGQLFLGTLESGKVNPYERGQLVRIQLISEDEPEMLIAAESTSNNKKEDSLKIYHFLKEMKNKEGGMEIVRIITTTLYFGEKDAYDESLKTHCPVSIQHSDPAKATMIMALDTGSWHHALLQYRLADKGKDFRMMIVDHGTLSALGGVQKFKDHATVYWANATYTFFLNVMGETEWGFASLGLVANNDKKLSKRLQEVPRQTRWVKYWPSDPSWVMREFASDEDVKLYDGMNVISNEALVEMLGDDVESINRVRRGTLARVKLTMITKDALIKGDWVSVPRSWIGCDVVYHPENAKAGLITDGWSIITGFEHHIWHVPVWDDQSLINNKAILPEAHQVRDLDGLVQGLMDALDEGKLPEWILLGEDAHTDHGVPITEGAVDENAANFMRWQKHYPVVALQNVTRMGLGATLNQMRHSLARKKMFLPMSNAFVGAVITYDALKKMANVHLPLDMEEIVFFHRKYGVVIPSQRFVETFDLHGTWDEDDNAKLILIKLWTSNPEAVKIHKDGYTIPFDMEVPTSEDEAIYAVAVIRSPNGPGEFSIEWVDMESMPFHNLDLDTVTVVDLAMCALPQGLLLQQTEIRGLPVSSGIYDSSRLFTQEDATFMVQAQKDNPGIGRVANALMNWANTFNASLPSSIAAPIGDMVDATQQTADPVAFRAVMAEPNSIYEQFLKGLEADPTRKVDVYLANMRMPRKVRMQIHDSRYVKGRLTKLYRKYNEAMGVIEHQLMNRTLQMRQECELVHKVRAIRVGEDARTWAKGFNSRYTAKLNRVGIKVANSPEMRLLMGDPMDRGRIHAREFADMMIQKAKLEETHAIITEMVKEIEELGENRDRFIIGLYKYLTTPDSASAQKLAQQYGHFDRVICVAGAKGQLTPMDYLTAALINAGVTA